MATRSDLVLIAVALCALGVEYVLPAPSERTALRVAQTGPLPTSIVNPRLGQPPNDSFLGRNAGPGTGTVAPNGAVVPNDLGVGTAPAAPGGRLGPMTGDHLAPPPAAVPNAAGVAGAVPPAAGGVAPPGTGAIAPPGAPAVGGAVAPPVGAAAGGR